MIVGMGTSADADFVFEDGYLLELLRRPIESDWDATIRVLYSEETTQFTRDNSSQRRFGQTHWRF